MTRLMVSYEDESESSFLILMMKLLGERRDPYFAPEKLMVFYEGYMLGPDSQRRIFLAPKRITLKEETKNGKAHDHGYER